MKTRKAIFLSAVIVLASHFLIFGANADYMGEVTEKMQ
jgi:hypothetical protein